MAMFEKAQETPRRFFGDKRWNEPVRWNRKAEQAGERRRVFCASMADVFERNAELDEHRLRLWALIEATPWLDWMLLTKRPQEIRGMVPPSWLVTPPHNVWYGTTVENQHYADLRIPILLKVPAVVRFLSMEPLLGPVRLPLSQIFTHVRPTGNFRTDPRRGVRQLQIEVNSDDLLLHWVITGGESGGHARPSHPDWYRSIRDQCAAAGVAYHHKQNGEWQGVDQSDAPLPKNVQEYVFPDGTIIHRVGVKASGHLLDGVEHQAFPTVAAIAGAAS